MKKRKITLAIAALVAFASGFLFTSRSAPAQERFDQKVRNDFFAGFSGNKEALERGMKACERTLAAEPKHAEAMVWHGSGLYYQGGMAYQSGDGQKGQELVMRGMGEMDAAVALAPDNVAVRIPRGAVLLQSTLRMPAGDFVRPLIEKGLADYEKTLEIQKDYFKTLGTHPRGELLFGIADGHQRLGHEEKATEFFKRISEELPGSNYQKRADIWLQTKALTPDQAQCVGCHTPGK